MEGLVILAGLIPSDRLCFHFEADNSDVFARILVILDVHDQMIVH